MKRLIASACMTAALLGSCNVSTADEFRTQRCMNMGNALDAPNEGDWGHVIQKDSFRVIKQAGFDTVRIPIRWSAHTGGGPDYRIDPRFFARVDQVINQALAQNLQIMINIHHFEELNEAPQANKAKFLALWSQIASRYAGLPDSVYFEVLNEPNGNLKGQVMRDILTAGFYKIRETNPTRILILGGENWSGIDSLPSIPRINDRNQVYTFHYYDPFEFTHQKASWTDLVNSPSKGWGNRQDRQQLKDAAQYAAKAQADLGIPIFLGEIGAYQKAPYEDVVRYTEETRKAFEGAGLSWCVWSFTETFPFYDQNRKRWDSRKLAALGMNSAPQSRPYDPTAGHAAAQQSSFPVRPFQGKTLDEVFIQIQRDIGRKGLLITSPYPEELGYYGPASVKVVKDAGVPDGEAIEITARKGANPWDSALNGTLFTPIRRGDTLLMSYWAKVVRGPGEIASVGLQLANEPYSALRTKPERLTREWKQYFVTTKAQQSYGADQVSYTMHTAAASQTLRVGPILIMNLGQNVPEERLPK